MTTTAEQIDEVLDLVDELMLTGQESVSTINKIRVTKKAEAKQAILDIIAAARVEELKTMQTNWLKLGDPECGVAIDNRIAELEGGEE